MNHCQAPYEYIFLDNEFKPDAILLIGPELWFWNGCTNDSTIEKRLLEGFDEQYFSEFGSSIRFNDEPYTSGREEFINNVADSTQGMHFIESGSVHINEPYNHS